MTDLMLIGPTRTDRPAYRWRNRLDGEFWAMRMVWNSRVQRWYLDIANAAGTAVVEGLAVVTGHDLLAPIPAGNRPPGQLFVVDDSGAGRVPTRRGFLGDFRMVYRPEADVVAASGTSSEVR